MKSGEASTGIREEENVIRTILEIRFVFKARCPWIGVFLRNRLKQKIQYNTYIFRPLQI